MKSEFYREVSDEHKTRKSTTKQKHKKDTIHSAHINPIRMSKGLKFQTRALFKSIDTNRQAKPATDRNTKNSISRPFAQLQDEIQYNQIYEKSIVSVCCECEQLRQKLQRELRSMKMHYEEQRTTLNEKFIQMQKKFLMKQNQCINFTNDYRSLMHQNEDLKETISEVVQQLHEFRQNLEQSQEEINRLNENLKKYQGQNKFFNHFLTAFVEQTRNMLYWCQLFQNNYEDLPKDIDSVREDLTNRKVDLDVILKQSLSYQHHNFGASTIKDSNNSSFFGSELDGTQSFMKYLKQNTIPTKVKNSRMTPLTEQKFKSPFSQALTVNKQNINTMNRLTFEDLIHSRIRTKTQKNKGNHAKDDLLRMMLIQAQTIEAGNQMRTSRNSRGHYEADGSILSSIRKRVDLYVQ